MVSTEKMVKNLEKYYNNSSSPVEKQLSCGHIALHLAAGSSDVGSDPLEKAEVQQWVEYISMYNDQIQVPSVHQHLLKELNGYLSRRNYFASSRKTLADIVIFFSVWDLIASHSFQQKEIYLHLSRWFNHMQEDEMLKNMYSKVPFSRTLLY